LSSGIVYPPTQNVFKIFMIYFQNMTNTSLKVVSSRILSSHLLSVFSAKGRCFSVRQNDMSGTFNNGLSILAVV
jgi:hypothetical protein